MGLFCGEAGLALINYYAPLLVGMDPLDRAGIWKKMFDSSVWWGRTGPSVSVMGAIANALWDFEGKLANVPCHRLLQAEGPASVPVYASMGPSPHLEEVEAVITRLKGKGFRAAKFGPNLRTPAGFSSLRGPALIKALSPILAAVRAAGGDEFGLMFDGHMGGVPDPFTRAEALEVAQMLAQFSTVFFEEPLSYLDPEGYGWLRSQTNLLIAGGESLCLRREFERFVQHEALDIFQPDANFVGGVDHFMEVCALAGQHDLAVIPHAWCAGPGIMANLHLAFSSPQVEMLEMGQHLTELQKATIIDPPRVVDGQLLAPTAPGLGIEFEPSLAAKFSFPAGTAERASGLMNA